MMRLARSGAELLHPPLHLVRHPLQGVAVPNAADALVTRGHLSRQLPGSSKGR